MLYDGDRLRMTRGDYGVPLTLHIMEHCCRCGEELEPDDVIRAEILRAGRVLFAREETYEELTADNGLMELFLTPEEAANMPLGLYAFRVLLVREGEVHNTLLAAIMEVECGPDHIGGDHMTGGSYSCAGKAMEVPIPPCSVPRPRVTGLPNGGEPGQYLVMTEAGAAWKDGPTLIEGPKGEKGDPGEKGEPGEQGPKGDPGVNGLSEEQVKLMIDAAIDGAIGEAY